MASQDLDRAHFFNPELRRVHKNVQLGLGGMLQGEQPENVIKFTAADHVTPTRLQIADAVYTDEAITLGQLQTGVAIKHTVSLTNSTDTDIPFSGDFLGVVVTKTTGEIVEVDITLITGGVNIKTKVPFTGLVHITSKGV